MIFFEHATFFIFGLAFSHMYEKTGIFVVATAMFIFNYGNFMKKETNSAKKQWTFFSFCLIKK